MRINEIELLLSHLRTRFSGAGSAMLAVASLIALNIAFASWKHDTPNAQQVDSHGQAEQETEQGAKLDSSNRPIQVDEDGYVTSDQCRECHEHYYDTWHASHHRTMTQVVSKDTVIADFGNHVIRHSGREFRFFEEGKKYLMEMTAPRPGSTGPTPSRTFEMVLSTGAHHQQAFWCATSKGRSIGKLPFIWINSEQRWIPYGSIFVAPESPISMRAGLWNKSCIECHVVSGRPRSQPGSVFDSHVGEFGISCEACHGPGEKHVAMHREANDLELASAKGKASLVVPEKLSHEKSSQVCGQCHAVFELHDEKSQQEFDEHGFAFRPGDNLEDSRRVIRYSTESKDAGKLEELKRQFWSDGMVRVSGREYNGLLETPCHQRGKMSCLSCHSMHQVADDQRPKQEWADDQLKPGMRGNEACVQCHTEYQSKQQLALHTHHAPDSSGSSCYNCHMPHTTLGLMKAMRSHTVDSPSVATTLKTGRPNACNLCHLDKTLDWTANHLHSWYGMERPKLSDEEKEIASSVRWILKGDAGQRAIVGWHYGWQPAREASGSDWMSPYLAELLTDSYSVVRFIGYHSLKELAAYDGFEYDFVGPKKLRKQSQVEALEIWNSLTDRPAKSSTLLIDDDGFQIRDQFQQLRSQRLDPPVILAE